MSRRRLTLPAYVRRRWRAVGAIVVLLLGALLVVAVTDRGHDPAWIAQVGPEIDQAALAPDGSVVYALLRSGGNVSALQARAGSDGRLLWESDLPATRAVLAASGTGVAVATDFPSAFLTFYHADGDPRWQVPLEGNPIGMEMEGERLLLALNAPGNPVLLFEDGLLLRTYRMPALVRALDLEGELAGAGAINGAVVVHRNGQEIVNVSLPMSVRSLRIAQDGTALFVGGTGLTPSDPKGHVAFLDVGAERPLRWSQDTPVGVTLVDLDAAGLLAMAIEEAPPSATVHVFAGSTGATRWTRELGGAVARDDAGSSGGAAISPDADAVAVATLRGGLFVLDADSGEIRWSYRTGGASVVAFPDEDTGHVLAGARMLESRPVDSLLLFHLHAEPAARHAPLLAGTLALATVGALAMVVGIGYWRARRPY